MPLTLIKSAWESGALRFRAKVGGASLAAFTPGGLVRSMTRTDIDAQNGTLSAAGIKGGLIVHTSTTGGGTLTFDTADNILALFPGIAVGDVIECFLINDGDQTDTLAADAGPTITLVDAGQTIASNESAHLLLLVTAVADPAITVYHVGA